MPLPFADLESRVNVDIHARLANATATIGGQAVDGIFHNAYASADGIGGSDPAFEALASLVSAVARGTALTINGTDYLVRIREDDGTGWSVMRLEKA